MNATLESYRMKIERMEKEYKSLVEENRELIRENGRMEYLLSHYGYGHHLKNNKPKYERSGNIISFSFRKSS